MYDATGGGKALRTYNSCNLAWWHTFKQACYTIWYSFRQEVFAPLWHDLYPSHWFFKKPSSLGSVVIHLLYINMAAEMIVPQLEAMLKEDTLKPQSRTMTLDLLFLFQVAVPVVISLFVILQILIINI
jgi:hypothetical protein